MKVGRFLRHSFAGVGHHLNLAYFCRVHKEGDLFLSFVNLFGRFIDGVFHILNIFDAAFGIELFFADAEQFFEDELV